VEADSRTDDVNGIDGVGVKQRNNNTYETGDKSIEEWYQAETLMTIRHKATNTSHKPKDSSRNDFLCSSRNCTRANEFIHTI
jgi:hypothetical protein